MFNRFMWVALAVFLTLCLAVPGFIIWATNFARDVLMDVLDGKAS